MVNMRVRQKHIVNFMIPHGQLRILVYVISLFHTAVYKHLGISHLQKMTAARYLMVGPDKCKSHLHSPSEYNIVLPHRIFCQLWLQYIIFPIRMQIVLQYLHNFLRIRPSPNTHSIIVMI